MSLIPPIPDDATRCAGSVALRYADLTQDGRLVLSTLPEALGQVVWPAVRDQVRAEDFVAQGAVPILTRMVLEGGGGPLAVYAPLRAPGAFALAHVPGPRGPERILLNMWGELHGDAGWTWGQPVQPHGVHAGRIFAEHVFTRLFAPPGQRRVRSLEIAGWPAMPPRPWPSRPVEALGVPAGARVLTQIEERFVFGLTHTDPNMHVNSLVYPRLFEELALRAGAAFGANELFARGAEILWQKPFFAGEECAIRLTLYEQAGRMGASGSFTEGGRPRCWVNLLF